MVLVVGFLIICRDSAMEITNEEWTWVGLKMVDVPFNASSLDIFLVGQSGDKPVNLGVYSGYSLCSN